MKVNLLSSCLTLFIILSFNIDLSEINFIPDKRDAEVNKISNVKDFGAKGDGITDDTEAIIAAIKGASDGHVVFPRGKYRISETIDVKLAEVGPIGLSGRGGSAQIIMEGKGPALRFSGSNIGAANPDLVETYKWEKERMPLINNLEIVGDHPKANGLEFHQTIQTILTSVLIRDVHHGILLSSNNRNVIISNSHIYNNSGIGIYLDSVNLHQINISNSHISYNLLGGIKTSSNSNIRNFQITGNDIEYNYDTENDSRTSSEDLRVADIWIDCSEGGSVREGTISGNTIQAKPSEGGANIRFTGADGNYEKIGLWSITGNHISSQMVNIHLDNTQGISITGNTFIRGYDRHMIIDNSRNVIVNANIFDNNKDYTPEDVVYNSGGISISKSSNLIVGDNILDGVEYEKEGVITVNKSSKIALESNQINNPKFRGIQINSSSNIWVTGCRIHKNESNSSMLSAIEVNGVCPGTIIKNNSITRGKQGGIVNRGSGVIIGENFPGDQ